MPSSFFSRLKPSWWPRSRTSRALEWERHFHEGVQAFQKEDLAEAERAFAAALRDADRFPPDDPRLGVSLDNLSSLYRLQGKHAQAESLCLRALRTKEHLYGPTHPNVASTLKDLAEIARALGKPEEAQRFQRRALDILERAIGPDFTELDASLRSSKILRDEDT